MWALLITAALLASVAHQEMATADSHTGLLLSDGRPATDMRSQYQHASWQVGNWSECLQDDITSSRLGCAASLSVRSRVVLCALHGSANSSRREAPDERCLVRTSRPANISLCNGPCYRAAAQSYRWTAGEWGRCAVHLRRGRIRYKKSRIVSCQHASTEATVSSVFCEVLGKSNAPRKARRCQLEDGQARISNETLPAKTCSAGAWGAWSPCRWKVYCGFDRYACQRRRRVSGKVATEHDDCSGTSQITKCQNPASQYVIQTGEWPSTCTSWSSKHSRRFRMGYRERNVSCIRTADGSRLPLKMCGYWKSPSVAMGTCVVLRDCRVTTWSNWTVPSQDLDQLCVLMQEGLSVVWPTHVAMSRERSVSSERLGGGQACPHLSETRPVSTSIAAQIGLTTCNQLYEWAHGNWSECRPDDDQSACHRHRSVFCRRYNSSDNTPIDNKFCAAANLPAGVLVDKPAARRSCHADCPTRCLLSAWSDWTPCRQPECGARRAAGGGWQTRTRSLRRAATGGRTCEHLAENRRCGYRQCVRYVADKRKRDGGACGVEPGDSPGGQWGCVYLLRWGARRRRCRCSRRCPTWKQVRAADTWRDYGSCQPVGARNASSWQQVRFRPALHEGAVHCPTEFTTRPCVPRTERYAYAWHAEDSPKACESRMANSTADGRHVPTCKMCTYHTSRAVYCARMGPEGPVPAQARKCPPAEFKQPNFMVCHACCDSGSTHGTPQRRVMTSNN